MPRRSPLRFLWISLGLLALLVAGAYVAASVWVHSFLRSEEFRKLVSDKTGAAFNSDASYAPLRWAGSSVYADSFEATGRVGSPVDKIRADQVRAEVNWRAIYDGVWRVDQVDVVHLEATFRPGGELKSGDVEKASPPVSGLASLLPQRFELGLLAAAEVNANFLGADGAQALGINKSQMQLRPDGEGWMIDGRGGTLAVPKAPLLDIVNFRSRMQRDSFFLTESHFQLGETGKVSASGEFARDSTLRVDWQQINLSPFLPKQWQDQLSGVADGKATLEWPAAGIAAAKVTGNFHVTDALLQNLPVLEQVAVFTGAPQFRRMPLQEISGDYQYKNGSLVVGNFVAESKGLMRVEGDCKVDVSGALSGIFRVGVTPQTLQWLPGSRERVFVTSRNGYVWTDVKVDGTLQNLHEDLSPRLADALKDEAIQRGTKALENLPGAAKEGVNGAMEILAPLLR